MSRRLALLFTLAGSTLASQAHADTIKVLTTGAFKQVVVAMVPAFESSTGHKVEVANDTAGAIVKRIAGGESFDVLVLTPGGLKPLAADGKVAANSVVALANVAIGVAVKAGATAPEIGTVEQFKAALLAAKKVAYINPASGGSSGIYLDDLFKKLGIADAIHAKAVLVPGGLVADRLVNGEADLAIHQISEILPVKGATLVGPLPEAVQNYTTYAGAIATNGAHTEAAKAFLTSLSGPAAAAVLKEKGMTLAK